MKEPPMAKNPVKAKRAPARAVPGTPTAKVASESESALNTIVQFGWTAAADMEHIDLDEREAKIELFLVPSPPKGYKATNLVVHFDLSAVPENVAVFTVEHPEPIAEKTYSFELKNLEFQHGQITSATPMKDRPLVTLYLATGAFANWMKHKRTVENPFDLPAAQPSTFSIRVSKVECRTVLIENVLKQAQIEGEHIEITVKD
jgi:hypothetical protein